MPPEQIHALEDRQILRILDRQKELGLEVFTDGELRRTNFMSDITEAVHQHRELDTMRRINDVLCKYEIHHTTVQFEHTKCAAADAPCIIMATAQHHEHQH